MIIYNSELYHYGVPRRSGRYKWGSGKNPYHHGADAAFRKAKADYKANKKAINKEHRKSLRNVKDYRKVDSMVKNYKDAKRTNKEAYAQAKKAYKQTAEYKAARRKKIAGIAAGTTAVAATAYLAKHPEKRAQMSNMIKDITQGKYRPRDLSGVAKAGRPNPNLKYGKAAYSKKKGVLPPIKALPVPSSSSVAGNKFRSVNRKYAGSANRVPHPDISGQSRKIGIGFGKRVGVDAPFQGSIRRTSKTGKRLMPNKNSDLKATRRMRFDTRIEKVGIPSHRYKDPTGHSDVNTRTTTKYVPKRLAANKDKYGNYYLKQPGRSALRARSGVRRYKGKVNRRLR